MKVLALDLGTSSVRAVVLEVAKEPATDVVKEGRRRVALARRPVRLRVDDGGRADLDPDEYLDGLAACLDEVHDHLDGVEAVATSCQWHSLLALDAAGRPATPLLTWADTRAKEPCGRPASGEFHRRTGAWPHPLYWTVRIPWLRERLTERLGDREPAWLFTGLAEYVSRRLLGDPAASVSMASGTGMLDLAAGRWDGEALALAGVTEDRLPPLAPRGWTGTLEPRWARRWPALRGVPWLPAVGDGAAATIGGGRTGPDRISVTVGTSAAVRVAHPLDGAFTLPDGCWRYLVDHDLAVTGIAYSAGGNVFAWAKRTLLLPADVEAALVALGDHPPDGLAAVPDLAGARPPRPASTGSISGLTLGTGPVEILAALLDGVSGQIADGVRTLTDAMPEPPAAVVLGGGAMAASAWWRRNLALRLAVPVEPEAEAEASAMGVVRLAETVTAGRALQ
ncbi:FGGY family carbohydrate kinase [Sphaerimonospora thailandensis]|uniref:Gluconate kinase n=1 Tax=Sphaerimonospora thailandensis TaxID=795644 RepID=A0A8J3RDY1_9ACTN|nr:FGGY family carbohydrate kinase [Sphaerimonospora thailandensis]GIH72900.1 gluconate kinase [Sphaerimonospora thailandensis]